MTNSVEVYRFSLLLMMRLTGRMNLSENWGEFESVAFSGVVGYQYRQIHLPILVNGFGNTGLDAWFMGESWGGYECKV